MIFSTKQLHLLIPCTFQDSASWDSAKLDSAKWEDTAVSDIGAKPGMDHSLASFSLVV